MSVTALPASAEADILANGELEVTHSPDSLWLRPWETDEFEMTVKNLGDRNLNVSLEYMIIECPGGTRGEFSKSFFTLAPGAKETVTVDVTSHAFVLLQRCLDETTIKISYGENLTKETASDWDAAEDHEYVTFELTYDPTYGILAVAVIVSVIAFLVIRKRRSKGQDDGPPPTT
ncbi:MAG: hypothetical protein GQ558_07980 [Thermoplasmata archaeon]|nr:hypothetical protein [Thermoplasmata archaeon]